MSPAEINRTQMSMWSAWYCWPISNKFGLRLQIFIKLPVVEFRGNPSSASCAVTCGQTDCHDETNRSFNVNKNPTRCTSMQIFIYCKTTLHVSGVTAPIIRSIRNCTRSHRYRSYYLYRYSPPTWSDRDCSLGTRDLCTLGSNCNFFSCYYDGANSSDRAV